MESSGTVTAIDMTIGTALILNSERADISSLLTRILPTTGETVIGRGDSLCNQSTLFWTIAPVAGLK